MSMPAFASSLKLLWSFTEDHLFAPIGKWVDEHRKATMFIASFALLLIYYSIKDVYACDGVGGTVACGVLNLLNTFFAWIVDLLGQLFVLVIDIFLHFAAYNNFGGALPVERGWPIVRDVCNMFFIVILLVSAFSTIIGYDSSLHYRNVLPKLLLQAVLINFSKTIILLLVDFSQVIMLSFVNAFQQAGPGNFSQLFQIQNMMNFAQGNSGTGNVAAQPDTLSSYSNVFISIMLALVLMVVANGVMVVMIMYVIARIILLWIALIFSPAAFFATAVPGKLAKGLESFTGKYWSRLSGALSGGPITMFFVWLTFAIIQQSPTCTDSLGQTVTSAGCGFGLVIPSQTPGFLNAIGNSQNLATFIVGVAMMLMALEQAVAAAGAVSETVGKYAGKVKEGTLGLAKFAALSPLLAARQAGRTVDRRLDITGKASTAALAVTSKIPIVRGLARKTLVAGMTMRTREAKEEAKGITAGAENLTAKQQALLAASIPTVRGVASIGDRMAYGQMMELRAGKDNMANVKGDLYDAYYRKMEGERAQQVGGKEFLTDDDKKQIKNRADMLATRDADVHKAGFLKEAQDTYNKLGDRKKMEEVKAAMTQDAHLTRGEDREKVADTLANDKNALNKMSDNAKNDMGLLLDIMVKKGILSKDEASGQIKVADKAKYEKWMQEDVTNSALRKNLSETMDFAEGSVVDGSSRLFRDDAQNYQFGKDEAGRAGIYRVPMQDKSIWKAYLKPSIGLDGRPSTFTVDRLNGVSEYEDVLNAGVDMIPELDSDGRPKMDKDGNPISKAVIRKSSIYDRVYSPQQKAARDNLKSEVTNKLNAGTAVSYATARPLLDKALSPKGGKMSMKDILKDDTSGRLTKMLVDEAGNAATTARATDKPTFDIQIDAIRKAADAIGDLKYGAATTDGTQQNVVAKLGPQLAETMQHAIDKSISDPEFNAQFMKIVEKASDFEYDAKISGGPPLDANIQALLTKVRENVSSENNTTRQRWAKFKTAAEARRKPPEEGK